MRVFLIKLDIRLADGAVRLPSLNKEGTVLRLAKPEVVSASYKKNAIAITIIHIDVLNSCILDYKPDTACLEIYF